MTICIMLTIEIVEYKNTPGMRSSMGATATVTT